MRISDWSSDVCSSDLVGRLEGGIALDQCDAADEGLRRNEAAVLAEHVEAAGARRRLDPVRDREGARLEDRVRYRVQHEEPVVAPDRQPRHLGAVDRPVALRSEEHTSELQSLMRISYAVFCL